MITSYTDFVNYIALNYKNNIENVFNTGQKTL